jgi:hypothetical protein
VITFEKLFGSQGLEEYLLIQGVRVLYCDTDSTKALRLELDIKVC